MDPTQILVAGAAIVAILGAFMRWVWPPMRDFFGGIAGAIDNVNGRAAKYDKAHREVKPAVPSLTVQLADLTRGLIEVRDIMSDQSEQNRRITAVEETVAQHARLLATHSQMLAADGHLHQVERITGNVAQAKVFDAITEANRHRDAIDEEPDTEL
jgi:hypothetical protein